MDTSVNYLEAGKLISALGLQAGQTVGDFGSGGAGGFAIPLGRMVGPEGAVVLFDVMKSALSASLTAMQSQGLQNGRAVWSNLELYQGARGIGANVLDAGVLINVLHQSSKPKDMLAEIHRMLKPGAKLLIVDWEPEAQIGIAPEIRARLAPAHVAELGKSLGFASDRPFTAGPYHWGMVLVKT